MLLKCSTNMQSKASVFGSRIQFWSCNQVWVLSFPPYLIYTHWHANQMAFFRSDVSDTVKKGWKKDVTVVNPIKSLAFVYLSAIRVSLRRDLKFHWVGSYKGKTVWRFRFALSKFQCLSCSAWSIISQQALHNGIYLCLSVFFISVRAKILY